MKCPKCFKDIRDDALFCGYCGQVINNEQTEKNDAENCIVEEKKTEYQLDEATVSSPVNNKTENVAAEMVKPKKAKRYIGLKILLAFLIIAIVSGTVLGLLTAKGIIDLSSFFSNNHFEWTDFSEADEIDTSLNESSNSDDKDSLKETDVPRKTEELSTVTESNEEPFNYPLDPSVIDAKDTEKYLSAIAGTWYYEDANRTDRFSISENGIAILKTTFSGYETVEESNLKYYNGYFKENAEDSLGFKCVIESADKITVYWLNDGSSAIFNRKK